jgi:subtilisin family serine protease
VATLAAAALLVPTGAAGTTGTTGTPPAPPSDAPLDLSSLPVDVVDVTATDASLRTTAAEVTVLVETAGGPPTVAKLRAESPTEANELVEHLDARPGVVAAATTVVRAYGVVPEPLAADQWNLAMVQAPAAWRVTQGSGVTVAVIDSGVDATHPDLAGRVRPEIDLLPKVTPRPEQTAHGTAVASLIVAAVNNAGMAGVAPKARILPVAALDPSGVGDSSTVARGIIAAVDAGARVINLSLGGPGRDPVLDRACAYATSRGAVVVAAAGNSYALGNRVQYPAGSPGVVAVGSVAATASRSPFSNTGPHLDVAAPGQDVLVALPGGLYGRSNGTSFATPHVSAAAALVIAASPRLSAPSIAALVTLTAQDDPSGDGRDDRLGYGVVRADRAVAAARAMRAAGLPSEPVLRLRGLDADPEPLRRGQVMTVRVVVQAKHPHGYWRADPAPARVWLDFLPAGGASFQTRAVVASGPGGVAVLRTVATRSGSWRARVLQPNGTWTVSGVDWVKVRP